MNLIYAGGVACIMAIGLYLLLSRHIVRMVYGIMLISAAVNLVIFLAGRIGANPPPVMGAAESTLGAGAANPLPQALVLTAIVIGFSLVSFVIALALKIYRRTATLDNRELRAAQDLGSANATGVLGTGHATDVLGRGRATDATSGSKAAHALDNAQGSGQRSLDASALKGRS